jgi:hypothetical protein
MKKVHRVYTHRNFEIHFVTKVRTEKLKSIRRLICLDQSKPKKLLTDTGHLAKQRGIKI